MTKNSQSKSAPSLVQCQAGRQPHTCCVGQYLVVVICTSGPRNGKLGAGERSTATGLGMGRRLSPLQGVSGWGRDGSVEAANVAQAIVISIDGGTRGARLVMAAGTLGGTCLGGGTCSGMQS